LRYVGRIDGAPSDLQGTLIESLISFEWSALQGEAQGGLIGLREAREHRRLFQKLLADFEKSLAKPSPAEKQTATYKDYVAQRDGAVS
jgi:hypothetical protein